jgi:predicted Fe-S protein YdhL (DUF1289 family)
MNEPLGLCEGCGRTLGEIASWGQMDAVRKDAVWRLLPERLTCLRMAGVAPAEELPRRT